MNSSRRVGIKTFSAGYDLVHGVDVLKHTGDTAIADSDLFEYLAEVYGRHFTVKIGNEHFQLQPQRSIPSLSVAVPSTKIDHPDSLLIRV